MATQEVVGWQEGSGGAADNCMERTRIHNVILEITIAEELNDAFRLCGKKNEITAGSALHM